MTVDKSFFQGSEYQKPMGKGGLTATPLHGLSLFATIPAKIKDMQDVVHNGH